MGTSKNNFLAETDLGHTEGTFEMFQAGVNATARLTDKLHAGVQLFARDLGPLGNYEVALDWAYLDDRVHESLGVRAGRIKMPYGFYNETQDIDSVRNPILLPQSVYPLQFRDFMFAVNGASVYCTVPLGAAGSLDYDAFGGVVLLDEKGSVARAFNDGARPAWALSESPAGKPRPRPLSGSSAPFARAT